MNRSSSRRWIDVVTILIILGGAGFLMYSLLPMVTKPDQQIVPPLPASAADPLQAFLMLFIVATAVGAPLTGGIVLAVLLSRLGKHVPTEPLTIPEPKVEKTAPAPAEPHELSRREVWFWRIVAAALSLGAVAIILAAMWQDLVKVFGG